MKMLGVARTNAQSSRYPRMLPETRQLLEEFYEPFNKKLAKLLDDDRCVCMRLPGHMLGGRALPQTADMLRRQLSDLHFTLCAQVPVAGQEEAIIIRDSLSSCTLPWLMCIASL